MGKKRSCEMGMMENTQTGFDDDIQKTQRPLLDTESPRMVDISLSHRILLRKRNGGQ
jgi:hypothetical protein